jgi:hypothetical protein
VRDSGVRAFWDAAEARLVQLEHGESEIDNNLIENAIRPSAVGKTDSFLLNVENERDMEAEP